MAYNPGDCSPSGAKPRRSTNQGGPQGPPLSQPPLDKLAYDLMDRFPKPKVLERRMRERIRKVAERDYIVAQLAMIGFQTIAQHIGEQSHGEKKETY